MILPIVALGDPVLKKVAQDIDPSYPNLKDLVDNMFQTMDAASGVGLAAPQVGLNIRLFVIDAGPMEPEKLNGLRKAFINPEIIEETGTPWKFEEGCLSIPGIRVEVERKPVIKIKYLDLEFNEKIEEYDGLAARVIQHEYDHVEGKVITDYLSPIRKRLLKSKIADIAKGHVEHDYRMKFPLASKVRG